MKKNIIKATAIYTGGGMYIYYAELEGGNWLIGGDEWFTEVNTNPLIDEETFEAAQYYEWQMEHTVRDIPEKEYQETLNNVIDVILSGKTIKEYDNFADYELEKRKK
jgi:hypothetical protein